MLENCPHCGQSRFGNEKICWLCGKDVDEPVLGVKQDDKTNVIYQSTAGNYGLSDESASRDRPSQPPEYGLSDESAARDRPSELKTYGFSDESASRDRPAQTQKYGLSDESASRDRPTHSQNFGLSDEINSRTQDSKLPGYSSDSKQPDSKSKIIKVLSKKPCMVEESPYQPGERVVSGQVIFLIEVNKMQDEICSPCDGVIESILVQEGQSVEAGEILATIIGKKKKK
ncbi:acetyl-CoA carboxylase biotin carboxyl carrier protein subunit [Myxococcota bacterium]|nr:acetyl-CoA carboxylase biotin carboxyl carrier protein subunit [Myxococcota bacterium]MBU1379608.1 acetyl-CoA carboxylase biotin carboxyl carrier protein subunit [Myxococcota bacterium]MBU1496305.1 acetyl-CoA carboxylase biotin carboxyl carrier protein subunit [Myxococcota bacterium]